jgi:GLPGLI family protein
MKRLLLLLAIALSSQAIFAQQKQGTITYERKINIWKRITDEQMRAMIPEFSTSKHVLYFSDSISLYKAVPEDVTPDPFGGGGGGVVIRMGGADGGELYKNFATATSIQANEVGGKNFLIIDSIKAAPWKISNETKQILGVTCRKATRTAQAPQAVIRTMTSMNGDITKDSTLNKAPKTKEVEVVAWFAENIPAPVGPEAYGQLPGAVLEVSFNDGETIYTAKEILQTVDSKNLKEPQKGKRITQAEYRKMMMDLMQNQGGGMIRMGAM